MSRNFLVVQVLFLSFICASLIGAAPLFTLQNLMWKWGKQTKIERSDEKIKVFSPVDDDTAGIATAPHAVSPGSTCRITFEVHGDVRLEAMVVWNKSGKNGMRKDYIRPTALNEEWKKITAEVRIPEDKDQLATALFFYHQSGWFEVRNFQLKVLMSESK